MKEHAKDLLKTLAVICIIGVAIGLIFKKCAKDAEEAIPFKIEGDVEYVYEGDSVVHHYKFDDLFDPNSRVKSMCVEYFAKTGYMNRMVLVCTYKFSNHIAQTYEKELFYIPDRRFTVKNITWHFTQTRKTDTK